MKDAHNAFNFNRPEIASEILQRAQQVAFIARRMSKKNPASSEDGRAEFREKPVTKPPGRAIAIS